MFNLKNTVVVISGAASGLGKQMTNCLAKRGANLLLLDIQAEKLRDFQFELERQYHECVVVDQFCDVTSSKDIDDAVETCEEVFGRCDVLINCAGSAKNNDVLNMTDEEWDFTVKVDETSVFKMTRAFAKLMKKNHYGRIINIASIYGLVGNTEIPSIAYHASKGAVVNFTRAVAAELASDGITCNAICPGYFNTELTKDVLETKEFQQFAKDRVPMQRYGQEGELDGLVTLLASRESSYMTGAIIPVDGGYTCV